MGIIDVTAYDVIYPKLLPMLTYTDWLNMRLVNRKLNKIMQGYLPLNRVLYRPIKKENLFEFLTKDAVSLRVLVLEDVPWLTDNHIKQLLMRNKKIKRLELRDCHSLSQSILQVLTIQCVELEHLLLGGCGWVMPEALEYHVTHHSRLQSAREDPKFKLDPLFLLGEIGLRSKPTERKKSRYAGPENLFHRITDPEEASKIDRKYHRKKLIRRPGSLLSLDVSRSHYLCDDILKIFFSHFNQITFLNIANIPDLTDAAMKYIAENLVDLKYLDVSENPRISDSGVYTVAKYCLQLRTIKLSGCLGVTQKLINYLKRFKISIGGENETLSDLNSPVLNLPLIPAAVIGGDIVDEIAGINFAQELVDPTNIMDADYHLKLHHKIGGHSQQGPNLNLQAEIEENRSDSNITSSELSNGLKASDITESRSTGALNLSITGQSSRVSFSAGPSVASSSCAVPSTIGYSTYAGPSAACSRSSGPSTMGGDGTYAGPSESFAGHSRAGLSAGGSSSAGPSTMEDGTYAGPSAARMYDPISGASSHEMGAQRDEQKNVEGPSRKILSSTDCNFNLFSSKVELKDTGAVPKRGRELKGQRSQNLELEIQGSQQEMEWHTRSQLHSDSQRSQQHSVSQRSQLHSESQRSQLHSESQRSQLHSERQRSQLHSESQRSQLHYERQRSQLHTQGQEMSWEDVQLTQATSPNSKNFMSHEDLMNSIITDDDEDELMMMD